jgi:hypothetical protein
MQPAARRENARRAARAPKDTAETHRRNEQRKQNDNRTTAAPRTEHARAGHFPQGDGYMWHNCLASFADGATKCNK